jgi:hypothetical protein
MTYLPKETLCFWPLPKISNRNWTFRAEISKTTIDRHVIFTEGNLMFLTTSQDFWKKLNISSRNFKNENWSTWHIYRRKPYVFDHLSGFLAETEHFEQKSKKRELIDMSYLPNETLCSWPETEHIEQKSQKQELIVMSYLPKKTLCFLPLPKISVRNWTFLAEISNTRIDRHVIFTEWNLVFLTTSQDFL